MEKEEINLVNIADSSLENYRNRLKTLLTLAPKGKTPNEALKYILKHSKSVYAKLNEMYPGKPTTVANYITVITKVFSSNPEFIEKYGISYSKWKKYLLECRSTQNNKYKENMASDRQKDRVVLLRDIQAKYDELKGGDLKKRGDNMAFVLLSMFKNIAPKRADLGNVRVFIGVQKDDLSDDELRGMNYIVIGRSSEEESYLQINKFKTAKHIPHGIHEKLNEEVVGDLKRSLEMYPREYLFVDNKGRPYLKNNSYSKFVIRTFGKLFGKEMGVSIWRHVWVSTVLNFQTMSQHAIADNISKMGTSEQQTKNVYKWINIEDKQECQTICKPIH